MDRLERTGGKRNRQKEMEEAARAFMETVKHCCNLGDVERVVITHSQIGIVCTDASEGVIGEWRKPRYW